MKKITITLFLLSCLTIKGQVFTHSDTLIISHEVIDSLKKELEQKWNRNYKFLRIKIPSNQTGWNVYATVQNRAKIENSPSYSLDNEMDLLPESIGKFKNLEYLDLSFLGLKKLPESITKLDRLKILDLSFNSIDIGAELEKIKSMKSIEIIKIYGCKFTLLDLSKLESIKGLRIKYSKDDFLHERSWKILE